MRPCPREGERPEKFRTRVRRTAEQLNAMPAEELRELVEEGRSPATISASTAVRLRIAAPGSERGQRTTAEMSSAKIMSESVPSGRDEAAARRVPNTSVHA